MKFHANCHAIIDNNPGHQTNHSYSMHAPRNLRFGKNGQIRSMSIGVNVRDSGGLTLPFERIVLNFHNALPRLRRRATVPDKTTHRTYFQHCSPQSGRTQYPQTPEVRKIRPLWTISTLNIFSPIGETGFPPKTLVLTGPGNHYHQYKVLDRKDW